ncbi:ulp1 protease family, C-terminal catalytic domain-containing protein, partial [Tanacetum coccineum]
GKIVAGSIIGGLKDTQEMLDFATKHGVAANVEMIPIDYVNTAMDRILNFAFDGVNNRIMLTVDILLVVVKESKKGQVGDAGAIVASVLPSFCHAILLCVGITSYAPLKNLDKPGMKVGAVGLGGVGHVAVKMAKAFSVEEASKCQLFIPYGTNKVLCAIGMVYSTNKIGFILDSDMEGKKEESYEFTNVVHKVFGDMKWNFVECNQQRHYWECGYYVMKWMHQFVTHQQHSLPKTANEDCGTH